MYFPPGEGPRSPVALGQAGAELRARSVHALPGVSTAAPCTLGFRISAACSLLALGDSPPSPLGGGAAPGRCQDGREMPAGAALRLRGRRRAGGGGGVEEPGPGSLPAYRTRKWRFPWVPERKKQSFFGGFFFFFPFFLSLGGLSFCVYSLQSAAPEAPAVPRSAGEEARFVPSPAFRGFIFFARVASVLLPFWRGGASPGALILGCRSACELWLQPELREYLWRRRGRAAPRGRGRGSRTGSAGPPAAGSRARALSCSSFPYGSFAGARGAALPPGCSGAQRMRLRLGEPVRACGVARAGGWLRASLSGSVSELGRLRGLRVQHRDSGRSVRRGGSPRARIVFLCRDLCNGGGGEEFIR